MYQQKFDNILRIQSSDSQSEAEINIPRDQQYSKICSFQELVVGINSEVSSRYQPICILHETQNSHVIKCQQKVQRFPSAQTCINQDQQQNELSAIKICSNAKHQASILKKLSKYQKINCLVKAKQFYQDCIIFAYYEGNLKSLILNNQQLSTQIIRKIMCECVENLRLLEKQNIVHGDIRPENILFSFRNSQIQRFVIADFSGSFYSLPTTSSQVQNAQNRSELVCRQSWPYRAPEWLSESSWINNKIDIWGLGCVLFECMTGENFLPLQIETQEQYTKFVKLYVNEQSINERLDRFSYASQIKAFRSYLFEMLNMEPSKRPTLEQLDGKFKQL